MPLEKEPKIRRKPKTGKEQRIELQDDLAKDLSTKALDETSKDENDPINNLKATLDEASKPGGIDEKIRRDGEKLYLAILKGADIAIVEKIVSKWGDFAIAALVIECKKHGIKANSPESKKISKALKKTHPTYGAAFYLLMKYADTMTPKNP